MTRSDTKLGLPAVQPGPLMEGRRPPLYGDLRSWALIGADSLELLAALPDGCIDAVVTDPPYGLGFNGETWDGGILARSDGFQAFCATWGRQACRVLRPGGFLVAFGAPDLSPPGQWAGRRWAGSPGSVAVAARPGGTEDRVVAGRSQYGTEAGL